MQFKQECKAKRDLNKSVTLNMLRIVTQKWQYFTVFCRYLFKKTHMKKKSSWMQWFRVYLSRLQNQIFSKPSRSRSLRLVCNWRWWWGRRSLDLFKDADKSDSRSVSGLRGRTNPEGVRQSSADSELKRGYRSRRFKKEGRGHEGSHTKIT